jgi:hypothetical protein
MSVDSTTESEAACTKAVLLPEASSGAGCSVACGDGGGDGGVSSSSSGAEIGWSNCTDFSTSTSAGAIVFVVSRATAAAASDVVLGWTSEGNSISLGLKETRTVVPAAGRAAGDPCVQAKLEFAAVFASVSVRVR